MHPENMRKVHGCDPNSALIIQSAFTGLLPMPVYSDMEIIGRPRGYLYLTWLVEVSRSEECFC